MLFKKRAICVLCCWLSIGGGLEAVDSHKPLQKDYSALDDLGDQECQTSLPAQPVRPNIAKKVLKEAVRICGYGIVGAIAYRSFFSSVLAEDDHPEAFALHVPANSILNAEDETFLDPLKEKIGNYMVDQCRFPYVFMGSRHETAGEERLKFFGEIFTIFHNETVIPGKISKESLKVINTSYCACMEGLFSPSHFLKKIPSCFDFLNYWKFLTGVWEHTKSQKSFSNSTLGSPLNERVQHQQNPQPDPPLFIPTLGTNFDSLGGDVFG